MFESSKDDAVEDEFIVGSVRNTKHMDCLTELASEAHMRNLRAYWRKEFNENPDNHKYLSNYIVLNQGLLYETEVPIEPNWEVQLASSLFRKQT
jgi:hypothetical protein